MDRLAYLGLTSICGLLLVLGLADGIIIHIVWKRTKAKKQAVLPLRKCNSALKKRAIRASRWHVCLIKEECMKKGKVAFMESYP